MTTDTDPDGAALFDDNPASEELSEEALARRNAADALLQKFAKPRPPAPTPTQRAESNGAPFVAYSAVHRPAFSAPPHITAPGVRVDPRIAVADDAEFSNETPRTETTVILPGRRARHRLAIGAVFVVFLVFIGLAGNYFFRSSTSANDDHSQPIQARYVPPTPTAKLDIPPPPELTPTATASPVPATPQMTQSPPRTPQAVTPQPTRQPPSPPSLTTKIPEDP